MNTVNRSLSGFLAGRVALAALVLLGCAIAGPAPAAPTNALAVASAAPPAPTPAPPAPPSAPPPNLGASLAADQATLTQIANQAATSASDGRLAARGAQAAQIEADARTAMVGLAAQLASLDAQIDKIVPRGRREPSLAEQAKEAPLLAQRKAVASHAAQAQAVAVAARDAFSLIAERRREGFSARVLTRSDSPLSPDFWSALAGVADSDGRRLGVMTDEAVDTAADASEPRAAIGVALGLLVAAALLVPLRIWLRRLGRRKTGKARPGFGKTGAALWVAVVDTTAPTLAVAALRIGAQWGGLLSAEANVLAGAAVAAVAWAGGILTLGRVLATETDAHLRLLPLDDSDARRLRAPLVIVALVTGVGSMLTRLNYVIGASVAATISANCVISLAYAAAAALILVSFGRGRGPVPETAEEVAADRARAPVWTLISLILSGAILVTLCAVFAGYSTLAMLTSTQIFWFSVIAAAAYLIMRFVDDFADSMFSPQGWASRSMFVIFRFRRSTIAQAGALVSAALQLIVLVGALSLALTPFGRGGDLLFANLNQLGGPIRLGKVTISPAAIAAGVGAFVIGMGLTRAVQRWIVRRYLPVTDWDAGVRNSVTTGVGYLGVGVALLCALGATGLGFNQIALVASALSVGIGFGLQNVVQNFVSGVILLVERPVKVGDWVNIDGFEGGIRRIRVRATEIGMSDGSTVIVPNSDLITKPVRNKTLGARYAGVTLRLSISKLGDVAKARELLLEIARGKSAQTGDLKPWVSIDSLAVSGGVNLSCGFYIEDPRGAGKARSDTYFEIIDVFGRDEIAFAAPSDPA
jgi:potassium-dependent mechanosensitive channel